MSVYVKEAARLIRNRPGFAREVARQLGYVPVAMGRPVFKALGLTAKQQELLIFIRDFMDANDGLSPSFEEMKQQMGLASKSGIHRLVTALEDRGHVLRIPNRARCIALPDRITSNVIQFAAGAAA